MLGISIYLGNEPIVEQEAYIRRMRESGFRSIFTSLHIPEDDSSKYREQLQALGKLATELDMELMADISTYSLQSLGLNWSNAEELVDWGVSGLRIDYGIEEERIIELSHKMKVALNASTITKEFIQRTKQNGLHTDAIEAWHNYYPRPETGLGLRDFIQKNQFLKEEGLAVMAFIPGEVDLRGPLYERLPTLEKHRSLSPFAAFLELEKVTGVDKILLGDMGIKDTTLEQFIAYQQGEILLHAQPHEQVGQAMLELSAHPFTNREDPARDCIRAVESRQEDLFVKEKISPFNCVERPIGTITVDNEKYLRYQGELQLTLHDLPADERVNVLGSVIPSDIPLLKWISANQKFRIRWV